MKLWVLLLVIACSRLFAAPHAADKVEIIPFRTSEYIVVPLVLLTDLALARASNEEPVKWKGGILFDDQVRDWLKQGSLSTRKAYATLGDIGLLTLTAYPFAEAFLDRGIGKGRYDDMAQLFLMDAEAFLLTGLVTFGVKRLIGRMRPYQSECGRDPLYDSDCNTKDGKVSFFSGHAAFAFTAAGLVCAQHNKLDFSTGMTPCYASLGAAFVVGISRVMAEKHYLSDVLVGSVVGLLSGYVVSQQARFKDKAVAQTQRANVNSNRVTLLPMLAPGGFQLGVGFSL